MTSPAPCGARIQDGGVGLWVSGLVRSCCDLVLADESTQDRSAANLVIGEVDHWWWLGFRAKVWRPSLVRAGLLGKIVEVGPRKVMAHWHDGEGRECSKQFPTAREGTEHLVKYAHGGLRFHDLRHSYATWLVSAGVPINDVSAVMGHEQTSTTLDRYTHPSQDRDQRVKSVFADFLLTPASEQEPETEQEPTDEDS